MLNFAVYGRLLLQATKETDVSLVDAKTCLSFFFALVSWIPSSSKGFSKRNFASSASDLYDTARKSVFTIIPTLYYFEKTKFINPTMPMPKAIFA